MIAPVWILKPVKGLNPGAIITFDFKTKADLL